MTEVPDGEERRMQLDAELRRLTAASQIDYDAVTEISRQKEELEQEIARRMPSESNPDPPDSLPDSAKAPRAESISPADSNVPDGPSGIAGWLILPAIGMAVNPFILAFRIAMDVLLLNGPLFDSLKRDVPEASTLIIGEILLLAAFFCFQLFVSIMFFTKNPSAPKLIVVLLSVNVLLTIVIVEWTVLVFTEVDVDGNRALAQSLIAAAIWIPYFLISKRVKNTFVSKEARRRFDQASKEGVDMALEHGLPEQDSELRVFYATWLDLDLPTRDELKSQMNEEDRRRLRRSEILWFKAND